MKFCLTPSATRDALSLVEMMMPAATSARYRRIPRVLGVELPRTADNRGAQSRLFRRLVTAYVGELGGEASLTEFDKQQIAQLATIEVKLADLRKAVLEGDNVAADELIRLSGEHRRALSGLRIKAAKAKPPAPTILDLAAELAGGAEATA